MARRGSTVRVRQRASSYLLLRLLPSVSLLAAQAGFDIHVASTSIFRGHCPALISSSAMQVRPPSTRGPAARARAAGSTVSSDAGSGALLQASRLLQRLLDLKLIAKTGNSAQVLLRGFQSRSERTPLAPSRLRPRCNSPRAALASGGDDLSKLRPGEPARLQVLRKLRVAT